MSSQPESGLVEHQQARVDGHDQRQVQLRHHAFRQLPHPAVAPNVGLGDEACGLGAIESRMHARDVVERLRDAQPTGQNGDVGDECDIAHEPLACSPGITPEHPQLSQMGSEAQDRVDRGALASPVRPNESDDSPRLDPKVDAVERDGRAEHLAQPACFNY